MSQIEKQATHAALNLLALLLNTLYRAEDQAVLIDERYGNIGGEIQAVAMLVRFEAGVVRELIDSITAKQDGRFDFGGVVADEPIEQRAGMEGL
jgi:hypothetical protein